MCALTEHGQVDLRLLGAVLVLRYEGVAAAVLLPGGGDGEFAGVLRLIDLNQFTLFYLLTESA